MVLIPNNNNRRGGKNTRGLSASEGIFERGFQVLQELSGGQNIVNPAISNFQGVVSSGTLTAQKQYWDPSINQKMQQSSNMFASANNFIEASKQAAKVVGNTIKLNQKGKLNLDEIEIEEALKAARAEQEEAMRLQEEDIAKLQEENIVSPGVTVTPEKLKQLTAENQEEIASRLGWSVGETPWYWDVGQQKARIESIFNDVETRIQSVKGPSVLTKVREDYVSKEFSDKFTKEGFKAYFLGVIGKLENVPHLDTEDANKIASTILQNVGARNEWLRDGSFMADLQNYADQQFAQMQRLETKQAQAFVRGLTDNQILPDIIREELKNLGDNPDIAVELGIIPEGHTSLEDFSPQAAADYIADTALKLLPENPWGLSQDFSSLGKDVSLTELTRDMLRDLVYRDLYLRQRTHQDYNSLLQIGELSSLLLTDITSEYNSINAIRTLNNLKAEVGKINTPQGREQARNNLKEAQTAIITAAPASIFRSTINTQLTDPETGEISVIQGNDYVQRYELAQQELDILVPALVEAELQTIDPNTYLFREGSLEKYKAAQASRIRASLELSLKNAAIEDVVNRTSIAVQNEVNQNNFANIMLAAQARGNIDGGDAISDLIQDQIFSSGNLGDALKLLERLYPEALPIGSQRIGELPTVSRDGEALTGPINITDATLIFPHRLDPNDPTQNSLRQLIGNPKNMAHVANIDGSVPPVIVKIKLEDGQTSFERLPNESIILSKYHELMSPIQTHLKSLDEAAKAGQGIRNGEKAENRNNEDLDSYTNHVRQLDFLEANGQGTTEEARNLRFLIHADNQELSSIVRNRSLPKDVYDGMNLSYYAGIIATGTDPTTPLLLEDLQRKFVGETAVIPAWKVEAILTYLQRPGDNNSEENQILGYTIESMISRSGPTDGWVGNTDINIADALSQAKTRVGNRQAIDLYRDGKNIMNLANVHPDSITDTDRQIRTVVADMVAAPYMAIMGMNPAEDSHQSYETLISSLSEESINLFHQEFFYPLLGGNVTRLEALAANPEDERNLILVNNIVQGAVDSFNAKYTMVKNVDDSNEFQLRSRAGTNTTMPLGMQAVAAMETLPVMSPNNNVSKDDSAVEIEKRRDEIEMLQQAELENLGFHAEDIYQAEVELYRGTLEDLSHLPEEEINKELVRLGYPEITVWTEPLTPNTLITHPKGAATKLEDVPEQRREVIKNLLLDRRIPQIAPPQKKPMLQSIENITQTATRTNEYSAENNLIENLYDAIQTELTKRAIEDFDMIAPESEDYPRIFVDEWWNQPSMREFYGIMQNTESRPEAYRQIRQLRLLNSMGSSLNTYDLQGVSFNAEGNFETPIPFADPKTIESLSDPDGPTDYTYLNAAQTFTTITRQLPTREFHLWMNDGKEKNKSDVIMYALKAAGVGVTDEFYGTEDQRGIDMEERRILTDDAEEGIAWGRHVRFRETSVREQHDVYGLPTSYTDQNEQIRHLTDGIPMEIETLRDGRWVPFPVGKTLRVDRDINGNLFWTDSEFPEFLFNGHNQVDSAPQKKKIGEHGNKIVRFYYQVPDSKGLQANHWVDVVIPPKATTNNSTSIKIEPHYIVESRFRQSANQRAGIEPLFDYRRTPLTERHPKGYYPSKPPVRYYLDKVDGSWQLVLYQPWSLIDPAGAETYGTFVSPYIQ